MDKSIAAAPQGVLPNPSAAGFDSLAMRHYLRICVQPQVVFFCGNCLVEHLDVEYIPWWK
jgi:hypothetical protein